jgi:hypothetical protein
MSEPSRKFDFCSRVLGCAMSLMILGAAGCGGDAEPEPEVAVETTPPAAPAAPMASTMATARIMEPAEGAQVAGTSVHVTLGADNVMIRPAGDSTANSGHHHLFLNVPVPAQGEAIPAGQQGIVHLGQAQTDYTFENLAPGNYTLIAAIGDLAHRVIAQVQDTVHFTVTAPR